MQIDEVHRLILQGVNKTQAGYLSHEELDDFFNRAQRAEFSHLLSGVPYARVRKVHLDLAPFKVLVSGAPSSATGYVTTPLDLEYLITVMSGAGDPVQIKTEEQIVHHNNSALVPYDSSNPMCVPYSSGFQMYPKEAWDVTYWYLATPSDVIFSYTMVGRTVTYSDIESTHPLWVGAALERVINRAIELAAEFLQVQGVDQKMQIKNERGL